MTTRLAALGTPAAVLGTPALHRPGLGVTLGSGLLAVGLVVLFWWLIGHAITIAHEGGHALVTVLAGGKVARVQVRRDRTGRTDSFVPGRGVPTTLAGYLAPSAFGLLAALLITFGRFAAVLWISLALLLLILTVAGTWFTRFAVVTTGLLLVLALRTASETVVLWTACTWAWVMLLGGLVHVILHHGVGRDHHSLKEKTWIPVVFWSWFFAAFALATLWFGFSWLTGISDPPTLHHGSSPDAIHELVRHDRNPRDAPLPAGVRGLSAGGQGVGLVGMGLVGMGSPAFDRS